MLATPPGSVHTHESAIDDHAKRTPGMSSSRDVTLIAFLTPYVKLAHWGCARPVALELCLSNKKAYKYTACCNLEYKFMSLPRPQAKQ